MKDNTLYMFIDEGGNFDFSPKGTKYFTLLFLTEKMKYKATLRINKKGCLLRMGSIQEWEIVYYNYKE